MISVEARTNDTTHYDTVARLFHWTLSKLAETAHLTLQFGVCLCIALHVGAALHHHITRHNDVLARLLPRLRRSIW
jgi:cytochrome b561